MISSLILSSTNYSDEKCTLPSQQKFDDLQGGDTLYFKHDDTCVRVDKKTKQNSNILQKVVCNNHTIQHTICIDGPESQLCLKNVPTMLDVAKCQLKKTEIAEASSGTFDCK
jgi:hypothetical protein